MGSWTDDIEPGDYKNEALLHASVDYWLRRIRKERAVREARRDQAEGMWRGRVQRVHGGIVKFEPIKPTADYFPALPTKPQDIPVPKTEAEVDAWIEATLRMERGALARLYRLLYEGENLRIDSAKTEERRWRDSLKT